MTLKIIFIWILLLLSMVCFVQASDFLELYNDPYNQIQEKNVVKHTFTMDSEKTEYSDGTGIITIYSSQLFTDSNGTKLEKAKSLKNCEFCDNFKMNVNLDPAFNLTIKDYNYTDYTNACFMSNQTGDIPLRINVLTNKSEKVIDYRIRTTKQQVNQWRCYNFTVPESILDYEIEWGWNSTIVQIIANDTWQIGFICSQSSATACDITTNGYTSYTTAFSSTNYGQIGSSNNVRVPAEPSGLSQSSGISFKMNFTSTGISIANIVNITLLYEGYFSSGGSGTANVHVYNWTKKAWMHMATLTSSEGTKTYTTNDTSIINASDKTIWFGGDAYNCGIGSVCSSYADFAYVNITYNIPSTANTCTPPTATMPCWWNISDSCNFTTNVQNPCSINCSGLTGNSITLNVSAVINFTGSNQELLISKNCEILITKSLGVIAGNYSG